MLHMYANGAIYTVHRNMGIQQGIAAKALQRLSSGKRINSAADDAAGLAVSQGMRARINAMNRQIRNNRDQINMLATAEGAMNETHDILRRMKELAVQASNGTLTDHDRSLLDIEYKGLMDTIDYIYNSTNYNGIKVMKEENGVLIEPPLPDKSEDGEKTLRDIGLLTQDAAREANDMLDKAIEAVSRSRAGVGAQINVLDHGISYLEQASILAEEALSKIEDADMAMEMMKLTKANILINVSQALMAQAAQTTENMVRMIIEMG